MSFFRIAYAMNPSVPDITREDALALTHLNLSFALIQDGRLDLSRLTHWDHVAQIRQWNPNLKIVLSVGGWGCAGFSTAARTEEGRRRFALSCRSAVVQYGLDGIDIDWEYPCSGAAGIDFDPADKETFPLLLKAIREALGDAAILSVAMGADESCVRNTRMEQCVSSLTYVQLMTYDMLNGLTSLSGHHAALYPSRGDTSKNNTDAVVKLYHDAGVPYEKIIVGAAFYTREFEVRSSENNGLLQPSGPGLANTSYHQITPDFLAAKGYREFWDGDAQAAYLWNGSTFVSYESAQAIRLKCRFVKEKHLGGLMYWEHGHDKTRTLLGIIEEELA